MSYLRIDGRKLHRSKVACEGNPCAHCFNFGSHYARSAAAMLETPALLDTQNNNLFYVEIPIQSSPDQFLAEFEAKTPGGRYVTRQLKIDEHIPTTAVLSQTFTETVQTNASRKIQNALSQLKDPKTVQDRLGIKSDVYEILYDPSSVAQGSLEKLYCERCEGRGVNSSDKDTLAFIKAVRKPDKIELEQYHLDLEGLARRVKYILRNEIISESRVLCVGDNDLTSLAICALARPKTVTVVDLDEKVLTTIEEARKKEWPITTNHFDIRETSTGKLPEFEIKFDFFVTDPPYTTDGLKAFIWLGAKLTKKGGCGYIALPSSDLLLWTQQQALEIQKFLSANGLVITERIQGFHTYESEQGLPSAMLRVHKLEEVDGKLEIDVEKFYTSGGAKWESGTK